MIAQDIFDYVRNETGGRFLNLDDKTKRWFVLPDAVVLDKIKQALRDKYVPFWAKNLDIPAASEDLNKTSAGIAGNASLTTTKRSGSGSAKRSSSKGGNKKEPNKLDFLLSAGRLHEVPSTAATAALPTMDDALKCKIDTLPGFGGGVAIAGQPTGVFDSRLSFSLPPPGFGTPGAYIPSMGMGYFHSVQGPGMLTSMTSLGAPVAFVSGPIDGVAHGFGMGGNSGAPSLGLAPQSAGLLNSFALRSADMERYLNPSQFGGGGAKSIDMLRSLTGGGMASYGSLGGLSIGLSDGLGSVLAAGEGIGGGAIAAPSPAPAGSGEAAEKQIGMPCSKMPSLIPKPRRRKSKKMKRIEN